MKSLPPSQRVSPWIVISIGILAVSTASIFIRYAQQEAPSLVIAALRLTLSVLILSPAAGIKHRGELAKLNKRDWLLAVISGIFLAFHFSAFITSLELTSVTSAVVFATSTPLWVAILSPYFLSEPVKQMTLWGLFIAMIGALSIGVGDTCAFTAEGLNCSETATMLQTTSFWGNMLALTAALTGAGYFMIGRKLRVHMSLTAYTTIVYGIAAIGLIGMMLLAGDQPWGYSPITYFWILLLALVPQLLGHSSFNWALGYLPVAVVSIALLGEPVGSTILALFLLGEVPTLFEIFGAILILTGVYLAAIYKRS